MYDVKRHPLNYYDKMIEKIEQKPILENCIMFYGSSGFTRWSRNYVNGNQSVENRAALFGYDDEEKPQPPTIPVEDAIRARDGSEICVNNAFGGSTMDELLYYYPRVIKPWKPKVLVLTGFANDWGFGYSTSEMVMLLSRLLEYARTDMPGIKIFLTDRRPTAKHVGKVERAWDEGAWKNPTIEMNAALEAYCNEHPDTTLVRYNQFEFLFDEGHVGDWTHVREDMFVEDKVHFTSKGYGYLAEIYKELLKDLL